MISPVTVIASDDARIKDSWLLDELIRLEISDDVFSNDFLNHIIFCCRLSEVTTQDQWHDDTVAQILCDRGVKYQDFAGSRDWPSGPYFLSSNVLYQAWKLYPDTSEAFSCSAIPDPGSPDL